MIRGCLKPEGIERAEEAWRHHRGEAERRGANDKYGYEGDRSRIQRQGEWGAAFVAQEYGVQTQALTFDDRHRLPDAGPLDVRSTGWPHGGLILHPEDAPERITVCVYVPWVPKAEDELVILGWQLNGLGQHERYWPGPHPERPCYLVPKKDLRSTEQLELELGLGGQEVLW